MPSIFFGLVEERTNGTRIHSTRNHSKAFLPNKAAALLALIKLKVLSRFVKKVEIVAYEDLGTEAIRRLEVVGFPAIVVNDCHGGDLYQDGMKAFAREGS